MKKNNITIRKVHTGKFEIRLSVNKVEIETITKEWKVVFARDTKAYNQIALLINSDEKKYLQIICESLFETTLFFSDGKLLSDFKRLCYESYERTKNKKNEAN